MDLQMAAIDFADDFGSLLCWKLTFLGLLGSPCHKPSTSAKEA
jgi:hypothetical protein